METVIGIEIIGEFPRPLVRILDERDHAEDLRRGRFFLRPLVYYIAIEDEERRDPDEGEARLSVKGVNDNWVNFSGSYFNPVFILCFHGPSVDFGRVRAYERFALRILDPNQFVRDLASHLESHPPFERTATWVDCVGVSYTKDQRVEITPDLRERLRLMYAQKRSTFAYQHEYRIAVGLSGPLAGCPEAITIDLGRVLTYVEPLY